MKTYSTADMTSTSWQQSLFVWQETQSELCRYINLKFRLNKILHTTTLDLIITIATLGMCVLGNVGM